MEKIVNDVKYILDGTKIREYKMVDGVLELISSTNIWTNIREIFPTAKYNMNYR